MQKRPKSLLPILWISLCQIRYTRWAVPERPVKALTIARRMMAPNIAVSKPGILSSSTLLPVSNLTTNPPMNAPMIPTIMFAIAPIDASVFITFDAIHPASAPSRIHNTISITMLILLCLITFLR